jgi:hypothetical protein
VLYSDKNCKLKKYSKGLLKTVSNTVRDTTRRRVERLRYILSSCEGERESLGNDGHTIPFIFYKFQTPSLDIIPFT